MALFSIHEPVKPKFHTAARTSPTQANGLGVPYAPAKRQVSQWRWYAILIVVASPLLFFAARGMYGIAVVSAPGNVSLDRYEIRAAASGYVQAVNFAVGDLISAGDEVIALEDSRLTENRLRYEHELASLVSNENLSSLPVIRVLQKQLNLAGRMLDERRTHYQTMTELYAAGAATSAEVAAARAQVIEAEANVHRAEADLALEQQRAIPKRDGSYENAVARVRTELDLIDYRVAQLAHKSDSDGRVIDIFVGNGEYVSEGTRLMLVGRLHEPLIVVYLEPKHAAAIAPNTSATVRFPDNTRITAQVTDDPTLTKRMPAELVNTFGQRPMTVMLKLKPDQPLPPGKRIDGLPLSVRFHYGWEASLANRVNKISSRQRNTAQLSDEITAP